MFDLDLIIAIACVIAYLAGGLGFILGYFAHVIQWRKFEKADFIEALKLMFIWILKAYRLNKERKDALRRPDKSFRDRL